MSFCGNEYPVQGVPVCCCPLFCIWQLGLWRRLDLGPSFLCALVGMGPRVPGPCGAGGCSVSLLCVGLPSAVILCVGIGPWVPGPFGPFLGLWPLWSLADAALGGGSAFRGGCLHFLADMDGRSRDMLPPRRGLARAWPGAAAGRVVAAPPFGLTGHGAAAVALIPGGINDCCRHQG